MSQSVHSRILAQREEVSALFALQGERPLTKGERTRVQLIETAIETIARHGFEESSISLLAKNAGISRPLVVHYFPTKEDLLDQIVRYIALSGQTLIKKAWKETDSSWEKLRKYYLANLDWALTFPHHVSLCRFFIYRAGYNKKWVLFIEEVRREGQRRIQKMIEEGVAKREFRCPDPVTVSTVLHRALYSMLLLHLNEPPSPTGQHIRYLIAFTRELLVSAK